MATMTWGALRRILCASALALTTSVSCGSTSTASETGAQDLGKTCIPSAERSRDFGGFSETDVTLDRSAGCSDVCLIANFRGRVSCPYGQLDPAMGQGGPDQICYTPFTKVGDPANAVTVPVEAQLTMRRPDAAVYCSCRCGGASPSCACPTGFVCAPQLSGDSYCIKEGTQVSNVAALSNGAQCLPPACGVPHPDGL